MIFVLSGGGSGATLVVTGVAGDTCTITNGTKTHTKTFGTDKKATFKGLATGTWTVKMTNGSKTSTRTITITADYALTITYFSATIKVTYPAKSKCVIKNSSGTQVASDTNTGTTDKTWNAIVGATGTYTITATATDGSGKTRSTTVSITTEGQSNSVTLIYALILFDGGDNTAVTGGWEGKKVTPTVSNVLSFGVTNTDATFPKAATVHTKNKIDLTKYNKLTVIKSEANGWHIGVAENVFSWSTYPPSADGIGFAAYADLETSDNRIEIDISRINTECYVAAYERLNAINPEYGAISTSVTLTNITLS